MAESTTLISKSTALQQAGLASGSHETPGICLLELHGMALLRLQSLAVAEQLQSVLEKSGIELPTVTSRNLVRDPLIVRLRPGEWLLCSEHSPAAVLVAELSQALESGGLASVSTLVDNSDGLAVFRLSGTAAPWLLAKISCLDFVAAAASGQYAARTRMGRVAVVVSYHQLVGTDSEFVYDLIFDRSIAAYLWELLLSSAPHAQELAAEFGEFGSTGSDFNQE